MAAIMSKATGKKTIVDNRILQDEFGEHLAVLGALADMFMETLANLEEAGYFGQSAEKLVAWAAKYAGGRPSNFEEYLEAHPLRLE